jgi:hypothetical protein
MTAGWEPPPQSIPSRASEPLGTLVKLRLVGEIVVSYVQARRALRTKPIAAAVTELRAGSFGITTPAADSLVLAQRLGWIVTRTLVFVPGDTRCLTQSLVLSRLLARRGVTAKLIIGTRTRPGFLAHAWVEHDGVAVLSPGDGAFARLVEL